jgi:hypothetical protein
MRIQLTLLFVLCTFVSAADEPAIIPPESMVIEGIPALPSSLAQEVGRYTEFRSASFRSWHPSKREMLIATRFADTTQIHHVRMPGGARTQLTFFADRVRGASYPHKRHDYFVFTKDRGGDEFSQIYRFDTASQAVTMVSDGGRSQNSLGPWSSQGDLMAYASTRRNGKDRDIYAMDPADPETDRIVMKVEGGGWAPLDWSPDDRHLLVMQYVSVNESYLWLVDSQSGEKRLLTPKRRW